MSSPRAPGDACCLHCGAFMFYVSALITGEHSCSSCGWRNFFYQANVPAKSVPPESEEGNSKYLPNQARQGKMGVSGELVDSLSDEPLFVMLKFYMDESGIGKNRDDAVCCVAGFAAFIESRII